MDFFLWAGCIFVVPRVCRCGCLALLVEKVTLEVMPSVCDSSSFSSVVRSTMPLFSFLVWFLFCFFERVFASGEVTDSREWLPWEFFCCGFLRWFKISFALCSCLFTVLSRLEILRFVLTSSFCWWSKFSVAFVRASAVAALALIVCRGFNLDFMLAAASICFVCSVWRYHVPIVETFRIWSKLIRISVRKKLSMLFSISMSDNFRESRIVVASSSVFDFVSCLVPIRRISLIGKLKNCDISSILQKLSER